jgi:hypothetical protein
MPDILVVLLQKEKAEYEGAEKATCGGGAVTSLLPWVVSLLPIPYQKTWCCHVKK